MTDSILDALEPADVQRVLAAGNALSLPQGWSPIAESTPADKAYLITEGEVSVRKGASRSPPSAPVPWSVRPPSSTARSARPPSSR